MFLSHQDYQSFVYLFICSQISDEIKASYSIHYHTVVPSFLLSINWASRKKIRISKTFLSSRPIKKAFFTVHRNLSLHQSSRLINGFFAGIAVTPGASDIKNGYRIVLRSYLQTIFRCPPTISLDEVTEPQRTMIDSTHEAIWSLIHSCNRMSCVVRGAFSDTVSEYPHTCISRGDKRGMTDVGRLLPVCS